MAAFFLFFIFILSDFYRLVNNCADFIGWMIHCAQAQFQVPSKHSPRQPSFVKKLGLGKFSGFIIPKRQNDSFCRSEDSFDTSFMAQQQLFPVKNLLIRANPATIFQRTVHCCLIRREPASRLRPVLHESCDSMEKTTA